MIVLNVAGGKEKPIFDTPFDQIRSKFILNVDSSYFSKTTPEEVEIEIQNWDKRSNKTMFLSMNIFEFLERTTIKFDHVSIYRFLEHVSFTNVLYFIYLISTITKKGSAVDVIVPNYKILASMILNEDKYHQLKDFNFEQWNIQLTTELLNEPSCPHASIWTDTRAKYFWELENRFKVDKINPAYIFDGREIYLRFKANRG